jgi:hypothetical protein
MPDVGENVGVREGQGIIEASTKLTLKSFHSCLDRRTTVVVRQNGQVRMPTIQQLWDEQSTPTRTVNGGEQEERRFDVETEIWDDGEWTRAKTLIRHPQHKDTEMTIMRSRDGHFLIGQDNHPSMLSESQSKCPECNRTLRFTNSGKTRYCRNGHVSGISVEDVPEAEKTEPQDVEDRSHLMYTSDLPEIEDQNPPVSDGWLVGMFLAEGCVRHVKEKWERKDGDVTVNENPRSVMWTQHEGPVRDRLAESIESEHAEKHGTYHTNGANGKALTVDSTKLAKVYQQFGRGSENKALPPEFIGYPDEWLRDLLAGIMDGDGTDVEKKRGRSLALDTTSSALVQQVLVICRMLDIPATMFLTTNRELTRNQGFRVKLENAPGLRQITERSVRFKDFELKDERASSPNEPGLIDYVRPVYYEERPIVYDIETESSTLSANGVWTHNTGSAEKDAPSFDRYQEITQLKSPNWKAHIAKGDPGEAFEVEGVEDVFAQDGKVGTDVTYKSKDTGEKKTTRVPPERRIRDKIEPGEELSSGEKITEGGHFDPEDLAQTKGLEETRDYLTRELHSIFNDIGGIGRRSAETTLRAMTDHARVRDPGESDFEPGEVVRSGKIEAFNQEAGSEEEKINAEPKMTPIGKVPFIGENGLAKSNFENLKRELTTSIQEGHEAETRGTSPISAYMYGKGFDKGIDPERWEY